MDEDAKTVASILLNQMSDPDEWCEYGCGCEEDSDDACQNCKDWYTIVNWANSINAKIDP
jgi:hypothetical protein